MAAVEFLLIDISNSFTKFAHASRTKLFRSEKLPTSDLSSASVRSRMLMKKPRVVVLSSVVPEKERAVTSQLKNCELLRVTPKLELGVGIDYPQPHKIGADRLANAAATAAHYKVPAVVIDFGTAVTFDIISAEKKYVGGVIAPGLAMMSEYLYQRTALLPKITLREPRSVIGKSTREAMLSGAVIGYRGLVKEILGQITKQLGKRPQVIATGGYASLIAAKLPEIGCVDADLTLEGLRIIGTLNTDARR